MTSTLPAGDEVMTMADIVIDNARRFPDVVAYRMGPRVLTHAELHDRGARLLSAMAASGVTRQDRIAVLGRNSVEFGEVMAACQLSGIVMVQVESGSASVVECVCGGNQRLSQSEPGAAARIHCARCKA